MPLCPSRAITCPKAPSDVPPRCPPLLTLEGGRLPVRLAAFEEEGMPERGDRVEAHEHRGQMRRNQHGAGSGTWLLLLLMLLLRLMLLLLLFLWLLLRLMLV